MDIQTPETASFDPADQADFNFVNHALDTLADDRMAEAGAARRKASRALFNAMAPHDDAEAALVALAVAAYHGAMDSFARADEPGASNEIVIRLRSNALAAARSYAATLRLLRKPQSTAGKETARGQTAKSRREKPHPATRRAQRDTRRRSRDRSRGRFPSAPAARAIPAARQAWRADPAVSQRIDDAGPAAGGLLRSAGHRLPRQVRRGHRRGNRRHRRTGGSTRKPNFSRCGSELGEAVPANRESLRSPPSPDAASPARPPPQARSR